MRKVISRALIIIGILTVLAGLGLAGYNVYDSWRANKASNDILDQIESQDLQKNPYGEQPDDQSGQQLKIYELYPKMTMPAVEVDGYRYIATLEIPSLNLKLPVMEDWDYTRLKISPCRYSGSAYTHDLVIAGHNYAAHFSRIKWLKTGSVVILTDMAGNTFHYTIEWTEVINPKDVDVMTQKNVVKKKGKKGEKDESADNADNAEEVNNAEEDKDAENADNAKNTDKKADGKSSDKKNQKKTVDSNWDMTLFTCTTGGSARFAARCVLTDENDK